MFVGPPCASQKQAGTSLLSKCLWNCPCRQGTSDKKTRHEADLEVVILLSDSEDGTAVGETQKTAAVCQCVGDQRTSGIVPDATAKGVAQVSGQLHGHVCRYMGLQVS